MLENLANESMADRAIRVVIGIALLAVAFVGPQTPWGYIGIIPLVTGLVGFCPLYRLVGLSTRGRRGGGSGPARSSARPAHCSPSEMRSSTDTPSGSKVVPIVDEHTSDQQLVSRIAEGDDRAFAELVRAHARPLRGFIRRLGLGDDDEDVLQRVFLAAYRGARTYEGRASLRSWLFTIARREAWRARAKNARQAEREVPLLELGLEAGWGSDPERIATAAQDRARVTRALAALPQRDREILVLRDIEGLSGPETCEVLELSLTAMKSRLHRARLRFAAVLKDLDPETNTGAAGAEK